MPFAGEQAQLITYCAPQLGRVNLNFSLRPSMPSHVSSCRSYKNTAEPRRPDVGETDDSSPKDCTIIQWVKRRNDPPIDALELGFHGSLGHVKVQNAPLDSLVQHIPRLCYHYGVGGGGAFVILE
jgi:hypothetical protein